MSLISLKSIRFLSIFFFSLFCLYVLVLVGRFSMVYSRLTPPLGGRGFTTERIPLQTKLGAKLEPIKTNQTISGRSGQRRAAMMRPSLRCPALPCPARNPPGISRVNHCAAPGAALALHCPALPLSQAPRKRRKPLPSHTTPRGWGGTPDLRPAWNTIVTPFTNRFTHSANSHYAIKQLKTLLCNGYKSAARSTQQKNSYSVGMSSQQENSYCVGGWLALPV